jgi:hypothetical protein
VRAPLNGTDACIEGGTDVGTENLRPPWRPGESGNPRGSSDKQRLTNRLRKFLDENGYEDQIVRTWVAAALGDEQMLGGRKPIFSFLKEALDRIDGPVTQRVDAQIVSADHIIFQRIDNERDAHLTPVVGDDGRALANGDGEPPPDGLDR